MYFKFMADEFHKSHLTVSLLKLFSYRNFEGAVSELRNNFIFLGLTNTTDRDVAIQHKKMISYIIHPNFTSVYLLFKRVDPAKLRACLFLAYPLDIHKMT